jgi:hypothetical protein
MREQYAQHDIIKRATSVLMSLQEQRGLKVTGTLRVDWRRALLSINKRDDLNYDVKIIVQECTLDEGPCELEFPEFMCHWREGKYSLENIIEYQKMKQEGFF